MTNTLIGLGIIAVVVVPHNILAGLFAFKPTTQLELESPDARLAPKVSF